MPGAQEPPTPSSLNGPSLLLSRAPRPYLRQLANGATLLMVSAALFLVAIIIQGVGEGLKSLAPESNALNSAIPVLLGVVAIAGGVTSCIGNFWLATSDPRDSALDRWHSPRRLVRIAVVVRIALFGLVCPVVVGMIAASFLGARGWTRFFVSGYLILMITSALAETVQFVASMLYVRMLAPRFPDPWLHTRATLLAWLGPVLMLAFCTIVAPLIAIVLYYNLVGRIRNLLLAMPGEADCQTPPQAA